MLIPAALAEPARARMLELFPQGYEEADNENAVVFSAYTDVDGEERLIRAFGVVESTPVQPGWEKRWRDFHRPVRVGPFWIGPPWERAPEEALTVVIDPGSAFGTGAHPTTRLCLELIGAVSPAALVDVGCGSGVLAIAAAKLGCSPVTAIDSDPAALVATRENARRNGVTVQVRQADALADPLPQADVAVANLTLRDVQALAPRLSVSHLIASGYLETEELDLSGFTRRGRLTAEGWAADVFERIS